MNILITILEFGLNGAVLASLDAVRYFLRQGHAVTVWSPKGAADTPTVALRNFTDLGVPVVHSADAALFDLFIADPVMAPELILACRDKCPVLGWVHTAPGSGVGLARRSFQAGLGLSAVDRLVFPSRAAARGYGSFLLDFPQGRIDIVPYAVHPAQACVPAMKRQGKIRVVSVGTIYPRKRQEDLIKAVAALNDPRIECFLVGDVVGIDSESRRIVESAPDRFVMRGGLSPEDLQRLYRSTDIFCLPSADESFGIAVYEAALHGIPLVLSDLECHRDAWRHGRNCLMHPVGDARMLEAMLKVLADAPDLRRRLGLEGAVQAQAYAPERFETVFQTAMNDAVARFRASHPPARRP